VGQVILITGSSILGVFALAAAVLGYLNRKTTIIERLLLIGSAYGLLIPGWQSDILGIVVLGVVLYLQFKNKEDFKAAAA
jgi:TRAP-type uncharacterized transport system fused permease subunit